MKLKLVFLSFAIAVSGVFALAGAKTANASSVFDEAYQTVKLPHQWEATNYSGQNQSYDCSSAINDFFLTGTNWSSFIHDRLAGQGITEQQMDIIQGSFNLAVDSPYGIWGFNMTKQASGNQRDEMTIFWTRGYDGVNQSLIWDESSGANPYQYVNLDTGIANSSSSLGLKYIQVRCNGLQFDTPRIVTNMASSSTGIIQISNNNILYGNPNSDDELLWGYTKNGFLSVPEGFDFNYPAGYEGEPILTEFEPPKEQLSFTPDFIRASATDWKVEIYDRNWFTFDDVRPFYCEGGLSPVIEYEIHNDDTEELITSGVYSPTVQLFYQHERIETDTEYRITGKYDCGAESNFEFTDTSSITYVIQSTGQLEYNVMQDCFIDEFPWFDYGGCVSNLQNYINLISFGSFKYDPYEVNNFDVPQGCHVISSIAPWLGLPANYQVCPAFSENVRNVVTPFVTFAISLTALYGITRLTKENT